jgi:hypothetical protein
MKRSRSFSFCDSELSSQSPPKRSKPHLSENVSEIKEITTASLPVIQEKPNSSQSNARPFDEVDAAEQRMQMVELAKTKYSKTRYFHALITTVRDTLNQRCIFINELIDIIGRYIGDAAPPPFTVADHVERPESFPTRQVANRLDAPFQLYRQDDDYIESRITQRVIVGFIEREVEFHRFVSIPNGNGLKSLDIETKKLPGIRLDNGTVIWSAAVTENINSLEHDSKTNKLLESNARPESLGIFRNLRNLSAENRSPLSDFVGVVIQLFLQKGAFMVHDNNSFLRHLSCEGSFHVEEGVFDPIILTFPKRSTLGLDVST